MLRRRRPSRSVDYLLAILSPRDVAEATRRYVATQSTEALLAHVQRAISRMGNGELRALADAFGYHMPGGGNPLFDDSAPSKEELCALIARVPFPHDPFSTFLQQNARALRSLDPEAVIEILRPLVLNARAVLASGYPPELLDGEDLHDALLSALPSMRIVYLKRGLKRALSSVQAGAKRIASFSAHARAALVSVSRWSVHPFVMAWHAVTNVLLSIARGVSVIAGEIAAIPSALRRIVRTQWSRCEATLERIASAAASATTHLATGVTGATGKTSRAIGERTVNAAAEISEQIARIANATRRALQWIGNSVGALADLIAAMLPRMASSAARQIDDAASAAKQYAAVVALAAGKTSRAMGERAVIAVVEMGARIERIVSSVVRSIGDDIALVAEMIEVIRPAIRQFLRAQAASYKAFAERSSSSVANQLDSVARTSARVEHTASDVRRQLAPRVRSAAILSAGAILLLVNVALIVTIIAAQTLQRVMILLTRIAKDSLEKLVLGVRSRSPVVRSALVAGAKRAGTAAWTAVVFSVAVAAVIVHFTARVLAHSGPRIVRAQWQRTRRFVPFTVAAVSAVAILVIAIVVPLRTAHEHGVRHLTKITIHPAKIRLAHHQLPRRIARLPANAMTVVFTAAPTVTHKPEPVAIRTSKPEPNHVMTIAAVLNPQKFPVGHRIRIVRPNHPIDRKQPALANGAEREVYGYLMSLSRGDDRAALRALGMLPSATRDSIPEAALLRNATAFHIIGSHNTDAFDATVSVDIQAPQGNYLAFYTLSRDGSAMRIVYHSVMPNSSKAPAIYSSR